MYQIRYRDASRGKGNFGGCPPYREALGDFAAVYAQTAEPIDMPLGADSCGLKEACIRWVQGQTNSFAAARGDNIAKRPLINIFDHLLSLAEVYTLSSVLNILVTTRAVYGICSAYHY